MNFRYSAITTAYQCLKKYELQYLQGIKPDYHSANLEFGTALHLGINSHFSNEDAVQTFSMYWNSVKDKDLEYTFNDWKALSTIGVELIERWLKLHAKHYKPFKFEEHVNFLVGKHKFGGTPDFIGEYKGIPSIVDWKTASKPYDKRKIQTSEQMFIYAHAAKQVYGFEAKQLVYCVFIKHPLRIQTITLDLTQDKLKSMLDNVELMADDLANRKTFPKNRLNCGYCEYASICYPESVE